MNLKLIIISIVCTIVGVVGGYLATPSFDGGTEVVEQASTNLPRDDRDTEQDEKPAAPSSAGGRSVGAPTATDLPAEKSSILPDQVVAALVAEVRASAVIDGDGEISGKVVDRFGRPIDDVLVCVQLPQPYVLDRWPLSIADGKPAEESLVDVVRSTIRDHTFGRLLRRETRTDSSGVFTLGGLPEERTVYVSLFKEGYDFVIGWNRSPFSCDSGSLLNVLATLLSGVSMSVVDEKDAEVAGAWITAASSTGLSMPPFWWTPAKREVPLQDGTYQLSAALTQDFSGGASDVVAVEVPLRDDVRLPIKLNLKKTGRVEVTVGFPEGERPGGLPLRIVPLKGNSLTDDEIRNSGDTQWVNTHDRKCRFDNVAPGSYVLAALRQNEIVLKTTIEVGDGTTKVDLELPAAKTSDYVVVRVLDPAGEIVRDASVFDSGGGAEVLARSDGSYWVARRSPWDEAGAEPRAESRVVATSAQYGSKVVKYSPRSAAEVTIKFDEAASLVVTIEDFAAAARDGHVQVTVQAESKERGEDGHEETLSTASGRDISTADEKARGVFKFRSLQTGLHLAIVTLTNIRGESQSLVRHPFTIKPGANDVRIKLPTTFGLVVQTVGMKSGLYVNLNLQTGRDTQDDEEGVWRNGMVGENGQATFDHLRPGTYALSAWTGDAEVGTIFVEIPRQSTVRFDARPANGLLIPIGARPSKLEDLGFSSGDILVGYDGEEWEKSPSQAIDGIDTEKAAVSVRVIRGGSPMEISVDPKKFNEARGEVWLMPVVR